MKVALLEETNNDGEGLECSWARVDGQEGYLDGSEAVRARGKYRPAPEEWCPPSDGSLPSVVPPRSWPSCTTGAQHDPQNDATPENRGRVVEAPGIALSCTESTKWTEYR